MNQPHEEEYDDIEFDDLMNEDALDEDALDEDAAIDDEIIGAGALADDSEYSEAEAVAPSADAERLQKLIAQAGVASRRAAEEIIAEGRVTVNGKVITEAGFKASRRDKISVDGKALKFPGGATVVLFHKPLHVVTTKSDPQGRATVADYLPKKWAHLHPVGRLDYDTSGLLLLSDDGELTQLLTHPSHGVEKIYLARVRGQVSVSTIKQLEAGVFLPDGKTAPCRVRLRAQTEKNALLQIYLREGKNRQVRRMMLSVGHPVRALRRVRVGNLNLETLQPGAFRELLPAEIHELKKLAQRGGKSALRKRAAPPRNAAKKTGEKPTSRETNASPRPLSTQPRPTQPRPTQARPTQPRRSPSPNSARAMTSRPNAARFSENENRETAQAHPLTERIERQFERGAAPLRGRASSSSRPPSPREPMSTHRANSRRPSASREEENRADKIRSRETRPTASRRDENSSESSRERFPASNRNATPRPSNSRIRSASPTDDARNTTRGENRRPSDARRTASPHDERQRTARPAAPRRTAQTSSSDVPRDEERLSRTTSRSAAPSTQQRAHAPQKPARENIENTPRPRRVRGSSSLNEARQPRTNKKPRGGGKNSKK